MGKMLGEELVAHGVINERQLEKGLQAQLIHGGHLGTCLIEIGCIDEQRLGETLAEILGVNYAEPSLFHHLPETVLQAIPKELAERHRAIPLRLIDERTLHVAMIAPKDLIAVDEIQFATGYQIQAWVAPEVRIVLALENHYGVPRSRRFLRLSPDPLVLPETKQAKTEGGPAREDAAISEPADAPVWDELAAEVDYAAEPLRQLSEAIDEVGDAMCAALDAGQLGSTIVDCVTLGLERTILFRVHKQVARIWDSRGFDWLPHIQDEIAIPVLEEPLFKLLGETGAYLGPPTDVPAQGGVYQTLRVERPNEVLLVPVYVEDHLVALLYGDNGSEGKIEGQLADYQRVAHKIGPALEIQALARRVRRI